MGVRLDMLFGASLSWREQHTLAPGQTVISTTHSFIPGSDRLRVYLNGLLLYPGIDYTETNSNRIDLLCEVRADDVVLIIHA